jgi:site-specific DNA-methyltransferase (adenine-specific)
MIKYETENCKIYCDDNVVFMQNDIDANSIDLTVTSPPYDGLRTYNGFVFDFESVALELYRITKDGGIVVWVVNDGTEKGSETGTSFKQALFFKEIGFNIHDTMIWEKPHFANPSSNRCHQVFEYMFVFSKGKPKTFNQIMDVLIKYGKPFGKNSSRKVDGTIINTEVVGDRKKPGDMGGRKNVWKMNTAGQETMGAEIKHPATFPEVLANDHIIMWSNKGDTVFDPFLGSGTTGKMAVINNRKFIGVDCSEEYVDLSVERIKNIRIITELPL